MGRAATPTASGYGSLMKKAGEIGGVSVCLFKYSKLNMKAFPSSDFLPE